MKQKFYAAIVLVSLLWLPVTSLAQEMTNAAKEQSKEYYRDAKQEIESMLSGKSKLSYERSIYLIENAWWDNTIGYANFRKVVSNGIRHIYAIKKQSIAKSHKEPSSFQEALQEKRRLDGGYLEKAKANYAIYKYMTDTTFFIDSVKGRMSYQLPFQYAITDPLGTTDWTNTQVRNLFVNGKGNCFAFVSLFKIYSERLQSEASICTAPGHVYISHKDENGTIYNVEVASNAFPGIGTLSTLTHTTKEAIEHDISLRELDLRQSIALCLVYLAKGYEHKLNLRADDGFMMSCAEAALHFDSLNLNAMLLKAEVMESGFISSEKSLTQLQTGQSFKDYTRLIKRLFRLGYREMPLDMKNLLIKGWTRDSVTQLATKNYLPVQKMANGVTPTRYASLSWGLFDEEIATKPIERYGRTLYDTRQHKIKGFAKEQVLYNSYNFDPILFALNVDPLAHKFPQWSPYAAMGDNPVLNIDPDGRAFYVSNGGPVNKYGEAFFKILNARSGGVFQLNKENGQVSLRAGKSVDDVRNGSGVSQTLARAVADGARQDVQPVYFLAEGQNNEVFFDNYQTGAVDVADFKAADKNVQAAMLGHIVAERYGTNDYEGKKDEYGADVNQTVGAARLATPGGKAHQVGINTEVQVVNDVSGGILPEGSTRVELPGTTIWTYGSGQVDIDIQRNPDKSVNSATMTVNGQ